MDNKEIYRKIADDAKERGEPLGWFEDIYRQAEGDDKFIPWAKKKANPNLTQWLSREGIDGQNKRALVVGCGLGDDAQALFRAGFQVTAFDISETCIKWCKKRFPDSPVDYRSANLLSPPVEWNSNFDFVFESYTLQALPDEMRAQAMFSVAGFVAPGGTLLVIARGRDATDPPGDLPYPLTYEELALLTAGGLEEVRFEDYVDDQWPPVRRFRVEYQRPHD